MTELEQKLQSTLKIQREMFKEELSSISESYKQSLTDIKRQYDQVILDQKNIIEKQSQTLSKYKEASNRIVFRLEDQQLQTLKTQVKALEDQVLLLQTQLQSEAEDYKDLEESFGMLQSGLKSLEEKL